MYILKDEKQFNFRLLPVIFIFTMMFPFTINGISMRYIVLAAWTIFLVLWSSKIELNQQAYFVPLSLVLLILYTFIIMLLCGTNNSFEILRYVRSIITFLLIWCFISSRKYSYEEIMDSLLMVLLIHSIVVILGIIFPQVKELVLPISQYTKSYLPLRSTGLTSGYDFSGFLCNAGLIVNYFRLKRLGKSGIDILTVVFAVAAIFTSRVNLLCMAVLFIYFVYKARHSLNYISKILVGIAAVVGLTYAFIMVLLTTNFNVGLRERLMNSYPALQTLYTSSMGSYTDYGIYSSAISRHFALNGLSSVFDLVFGVGYRISTSDIGYIKSIYSAGIITVVIEIVVYLYTIFVVKTKARKYNNLISLFENDIFLPYMILVVLMFIMEFKGSFVYSTTCFEMMSVVYLCNIFLTPTFQYEWT